MPVKLVGHSVPGIALKALHTGPCSILVSALYYLHFPGEKMESEKGVINNQRKIKCSHYWQVGKRSSGRNCRYLRVLKVGGQGTPFGGFCDLYACFVLFSRWLGW